MQIEQSFRMMKDVLDLRPFYHKIECRVKAHVMLCFMALFLSKFLEKFLTQKKINLTAPMAWESLKKIHICELDFDGTKYQYATEATYLQKIILNSLGIKPLERLKIF